MDGSWGMRVLRPSFVGSGGGVGAGGQKEKSFVAEVLWGHPPLPFQTWRQNLEESPLVTRLLLSVYPCSLSLSQYTDQCPFSNLSLAILNLDKIETQKHYMKESRLS